MIAYGYYGCYGICISYHPGFLELTVSKVWEQNIHNSVKKIGGAKLLVSF